MHHGIYVFSFVALATLIAGCKSTEAPKEVPEVDVATTYVSLAHDKFGENAEFVENRTGEFVLVVSKAAPTAMDPNPSVSFFVFGKDQDAITYESEVIGSVTWLDDYHLEVVIVPGIVKADSSPRSVTYRVDARSGARVEMGTPARH